MKFIANLFIGAVLMVFSLTCFLIVAAYYMPDRSCEVSDSDRNELQGLINTLE